MLHLCPSEKSLTAAEGLTVTVSQEGRGRRQWIEAGHTEHWCCPNKLNQWCPFTRTCDLEQQRIQDFVWPMGTPFTRSSLIFLFQRDLHTGYAVLTLGSSSRLFLLLLLLFVALVGHVWWWRRAHSSVSQSVGQTTREHQYKSTLWRPPIDLA